MQFDLKKFESTGKKPYEQALELDVSGYDFPGYAVRTPVVGQLQVQSEENGVRLQMVLHAQVDAECARCLTPLVQTFDLQRDWLLRPGEDEELPISADKVLDVTELACQELVLEVPPVLLCSPDCQGLCPICGKPKAAGCTCCKAENAAPADARLAILKQLLQDETAE